MELFQKPYATAAGITKYYRQLAQWREVARTQVCKYIPSVSPGYNDRAIRIEKDHPPLSRKLNCVENMFGSLFKYALRKAIPQVDRGANYLAHGEFVQRMARRHADRTRQWHYDDHAV